VGYLRNQDQALVGFLVADVRGFLYRLVVLREGSCFNFQ